MKQNSRHQKAAERNSREKNGQKHGKFNERNEHVVLNLKHAQKFSFVPRPTDGGVYVQASLHTYSNILSTSYTLHAHDRPVSSTTYLNINSSPSFETSIRKEVINTFTQDRKRKKGKYFLRNF